MIHEVFYKTEGNLYYPDHRQLNWGGYYFHSKEKAIGYMDTVLKYMVDWVNEKDPSLNIQPTNVVKTNQGCLMNFKIKVWKNNDELQECNAFIEVEMLVFEDESIKEK